MVEWMVLFHIWEVLGLNLSPETGYSDSCFCGLSHLRGKCWSSTLKQTMIISKSLPIHHSQPFSTSTLSNACSWKGVVVYKYVKI